MLCKRQGRRSNLTTFHKLIRLKWIVKCRNTAADKFKAQLNERCIFKYSKLLLFLLSPVLRPFNQAVILVHSRDILLLFTTWVVQQINKKQVVSIRSAHLFRTCLSQSVTMLQVCHKSDCVDIYSTLCFIDDWIARQLIPFNTRHWNTVQLFSPVCI